MLAHPVFFDRYGKIKAPFDEGKLLPEMLAEGLAGLEVYYSGYDAVTIEFLLGRARHYGLLVTGGTDFHGVRQNEPDLGGVYVPMKVVRRLKERAAAG